MLMIVVKGGDSSGIRGPSETPQETNCVQFICDEYPQEHQFFQ